MIHYMPPDFGDALRRAFMAWLAGRIAAEFCPDLEHLEPMSGAMSGKCPENVRNDVRAVSFRTKKDNDQTRARDFSEIGDFA